MSEYLDLDTGPIHWKDYGGRGPHLMMIHGLGGSIATWDGIGTKLAERHKVTAIDLPGFGLSPPGQDWSLETHRDAAVGFIRALGGHPTILLGNSMGGLVAEMVAAREPDLVSLLVLISPATPPRLPDSQIHWPMAVRLLLGATPVVGQMLNRRVIDSMSSRDLVTDLLGRITHDPDRISPDLVESFVQIAEARKALPWSIEAVPKTGRSIGRFLFRRRHFVEMIRRIESPTLVVQGRSDPVVSPNSVEWLCSLRLDWDLVQMEDTGHTPQIDAPDRFLSVVDEWLDAREPIVQHTMGEEWAI